MKFPSEGLVFDYVFDDGGLSQGEAAGDEEADEDARAEVRTQINQTFNIERVFEESTE